MLLTGQQVPAASSCRLERRLQRRQRLAATTTKAPPDAATKLAGQGVPAWEDLLSDREVAQRLPGFAVRPGQRPTTVSGSVLPTAESTVTKKEVLLYRDPENWCPHCNKVMLALEEKGIAWDSVFINLRDKPAWYKRKVPTTQVPAAYIKQHDGTYKLVWESFDILKALEESFPEHSLLPADASKREEALELAGRSTELDLVGYRFMAGGPLMTRERGSGEPDAEALDKAQSEFLAKLGDVEALLGKHPEGPFFMGDFSLADVTWSSALERLAANLPVLRHVSLRNAETHPNLSAWFAAMNARPTYANIKSDDVTHNLIARKLFSIAGAADQIDEADRPAREEAALKVQRNRRAIVDDILKGSGILRGRCNLYGGTMGSVNGYSTEASFPQREAIEFALRRVCHYLLTGQTGSRHEHKEASALGSASLAFFHNRASSPRDLSAAAAEQLRAACLKILLSMY